VIEELTHTTIEFARQYFLLRKSEGRIYSDKEVAGLPEIDNGHRHYQEWQIRKDSSDRLIKHLVKKQKSLEILEVGCGNGWLSAKLSTIPLSRVSGIDINDEELNQGKRVFNKIENLEFFNCSLQDELFIDRKFDVIVFAASVQYFSSLEKILHESLKRLKPEGEVHIIDSHLYKQNETDAARLRSKDYYKVIGFPEMSDQYFHHSLEGLKSFNYDILFDPGSIINKFKRNKNPFYWICIRSNA
jgi:ubiquinone/menaquinone biosynthesis C-methylase UbiE